MVETAALTPEQHAGCIMWGATVLIVGAILKFTPQKWIDKIPSVVDENKPPSEDKLTGVFNKLNAPVTKKSSGVEPENL